MLKKMFLGVVMLFLLFVNGMEAASMSRKEYGEAYSKDKTEQILEQHKMPNYRKATFWVLDDARFAKGEALLGEFGSTYMPNAYGQYETLRERTLELRQVIEEVFPDWQSIDNNNPKWDAFTKVIGVWTKNAGEMQYQRMALCHNWLSFQFKQLSSEQLMELDGNPLVIDVDVVSGEWSNRKQLSDTYAALEEKQLAFLAKHMPESDAVYQQMIKSFAEFHQLCADVLNSAETMDCPQDYIGMTEFLRHIRMVKEINRFSKDIQTAYYEHRSLIATSEDIAGRDSDLAEKMKASVDMLSSSNFIVKILLGEMVNIPGKDYKMQRTEVTQGQWRAVMGSNPSEFQKGDDYPVENVSWEDAMKFCAILNFIGKDVIPSGYQFSLPTEAQWEYACRAGTQGDTYGNLDEIAWYDENSGYLTHRVGVKKPNAWGFYDTLGNVSEWCLNKEGSNRVNRGGCWDFSASYCRAASRFSYVPAIRNGGLGFRLALVPVQ